MQSHDKTVIIGSKVQCQNCIFAHICKTAIIFGLLSRKKNVFEGHFLCDLYHFIVWFHVKKVPQDFCKLQMCKCFFAKTQNIKHLIKLKCLLYYQYAHSCSDHDFFWTPQLIYTLQWLQKAYIWKAVMNQTLNESSGLYVTLWKCSLYVSMP